MKKSYRGWGFYISLIVVVVLVWFLLDGQHLNQDDYNYAQFKQELADEFIAALTCVWSNVYSVYDCYEQSGSRRWWWQQDDEFWKKPGKDDHR